MERLGNICKFQSGGTPSKSESSYYNGNIPWISTVSLNGGVIGEENAVEWITEKAITKSAAKIVPANSIMVGTRVGIGKVAINSIPMSTSQDIISLIDIDECKWSKPFICKFILSKNAYLNSQARGATIKGIKIDTLANLQLPNLSLEKQSVISCTIDISNDLISLRKQQLAKLDELVKSRFVEMFGNTASSDWRTMAEICSIITDGTHQPPRFVSDGIPFLFVSNITSNILTYHSEKFIDEQTYSELIKRTPIEIGDILLSTVGSYGHPAVVKKPIRFCFQRHIAYLKPKSDMVDSDYLHGAMLSSIVQAQIEEKVKGIAQKTLNLSEIRTIRVPVPEMHMQRAFAHFAAEIDKSKLAMKKSLEELEMLKKSLMQKYFG